MDPTIVIRYFTIFTRGDTVVQLVYAERRECEMAVPEFETLASNMDQVAFVIYTDGSRILAINPEKN